MKKRSSLSTRIVRAGVLGLGSVAAMAALTSGCLDRPVSPAKPNTTNVIVDQIRQDSVNKIDMLFMIDNSISMADKQVILADAVPALVGRLVTPICVDSTTKQPVGGSANPTCANGEPEFPPIRDIHLGVVTSALGSFGGDTCSSGAEGQDDKGRLVGSVRTITQNHENLPFLKWNPDTDPVDQAGSGTLITEFTEHVIKAGESGCGYEASLEAWYRFLIDPQPPESVIKDGAFTTALRCEGEGSPCGANGTCINTFCADNVVLAQRQQFLRPDSLVAVVMLSDENDCSIRADGQSWLVTLGNAGLPKATPACETDPDSPACTSCGVGGSGCEGQAYPATEDHVNLRCWEQKRRFGVDFLYPANRYVQGLNSPSISDRTGAPTPNPLFATGGGVSRDPSLVFLAGVVGVPWQLLATPDTQAPGVPLRYLDANQVDWAKITKAGHQPPGDPHMVEQPGPRGGLPTFATPNTDPYHGHEWDIAAAGGNNGPNDLQFACIFPLPQTRDCSGATGGCDCNNAGINGKSPLCYDGANFTSIQRYAKAYPGLRQLEVLRDFNNVNAGNAIPASICPKDSQNADKTNAGYGYNPAVNAIIDRLKAKLAGACLTRPVTINEAGEPQCAIVEAVPAPPTGCGGCNPAANRSAPDEKLIKPVLDGLRRENLCGPKSVDGRPCDTANWCLCGIGLAGDSCKNDVNVSGGTIGWCYIDPEQGVGNPELVKDCSPQRQLRFVGDNTPQNGSIVFIACLGSPL